MSMKKLNLVSKIGLAAIALLCQVTSVKSQVCDVSYQYRTPIVIKNTGVALTNHAVKLTINTSTLVSAGKMLASGNDIRFTDTLCNQLNYWIESGMNTAATVIWVKIPSLTAAANRTINMYYSNPSAGAVSNGSGVFEFFDDFSGSTINLSKWNVYGSSASLSGSGILNLNGSDVELVTIGAFATPNITESNMTSVGSQYNCIGQLPSGSFVNGFCATNSGGTGRLAWTQAACASWAWAGSYNTGANFPTGTWSLSWLATNNGSVTTPAGTITTSSTTSMPSTTRSSIGITCYGGAGTLSSDWFRVRKYAAVEPTLTVGAEVVNYVLRVNNMSTGINATNYSTWCNNVTMYMIPEVGGRFNNPCFVRLQMSDASGSFSNPKVIQRFNFSNQNLFLSLWNIIGVFDSGSLASPNVPYGTGYKFRLVSSSINYTGPPSANSYTFGATPVPNFTINNAAQCNEIDKFTFTNSGTIGAGNSAVYNWDFGDTSTGTGSPVSHGYAYHGTKNVKLVSVNSQVPQCAD